MAAKPKKRVPVVGSERVQSAAYSRFNPIRGLTPHKLAVYLDQFDAGYLGGLAELMEKVEERDDTCVCVAPKRKKAVARHGFEIVSFDDSPEAAAQKEALEYFFGALTATSAVDEDVAGDINLLIEQMMDAEGKRWAAHEIVWQPGDEGLTATFRFVPLRFFEHTGSRLRYLPREGMLTGVDLEPGEWLVTRGSGLMVACTILYLFKHLPLQDLLRYSERYAVPGLHGKTPAAPGSDEWNALRDALTYFGMDWKLITSTTAEINAIDVSAKGDLPQPALIDRMSRAIAAIWRGGDLSTMSADNSVGATVQDDEKSILEDSDIELIEGTLNRKVVPFVIRYTRGAVPVRAAFRLIRPQRADVEQERRTDEFLLRAGCPVGIADLLERYGRPRPDTGEELAVWRQPAGGDSAPLANTLPASLAAALVNADPHAAAVIAGDRAAEKLRSAAALEFADALQADSRELADLINSVLQADENGIYAALKDLQTAMPATADRMLAAPQAADALSGALTAALINGYAEGLTGRQTK